MVIAANSVVLADSFRNLGNFEDKNNFHNFRTKIVPGDLLHVSAPEKDIHRMFQVANDTGKSQPGGTIKDGIPY